MAGIGTVVALIKTLAPKVSPEVIEAAVSDWLDDHPEATTTVEDGSITEQKLAQDVLTQLGEIDTVKSELQGKAPAIVDYTEQAFFHENLSPSTSIRFVGNAYAFGTAKYANKKNLFPNTTGNTTNKNGVVIERHGKFITIEGTCNGNTSTQVYNGTLTNLAPGSYKLVVMFGLGDSVISTLSDADMRVSIAGTKYQQYVTLDGDKRFVYDVTIGEEDTTTLYASVAVINGNKYDGFAIWYGLFPADVVFVDTNEVVENGEEYDFPVNINTSGSVIETCQHESIITVIADTKGYIDNHIPADVVTEDKLIYVMPEMFGAKGNGTADDTTPLQNSIDYAITNSVPLKAYGIYKTTSPIVFNQSSSNAEKNNSFTINKIVYTGNTDAAVKILGANGIFEFGFIKGTSADGVWLTAVDGKMTVNNKIFANYVYCSGICCKVDCEAGNVMYNVIRILSANSINGNCFYTGQGSRNGENRYYDSKCKCENGWAIYGANGRYYNFSIEANCKNGIYVKTGDTGTFASFRLAELMNHYEEGVSGYALKVVGENVAFRCFFPEVYLKCIDVSEMLDEDHVTNSTYKTKGSIINGVIVGQSKSRLGKNAQIRCGKVICEPEIQSVRTISSTPLDLTEVEPIGYPTKFIIDVADCEIKLPASYCCIGYNSFIVDQSTTGKTCTIYKYGDDVTPAFEGSSLGEGVYRVDIYCGGTGNIIYDGTNDVWVITKIE